MYKFTNFIEDVLWAHKAMFQTDVVICTEGLNICHIGDAYRVQLNENVYELHHILKKDESEFDPGGIVTTRLGANTDPIMIIDLILESLCDTRIRQIKDDLYYQKERAEMYDELHRKTP